MTSPMPSLPPLNNVNNNKAMNDNNELVEATISYMNTMPPLPHNQPPTHNAVSPASRHEGQHYNHRQQQRTSHHHQYQQQYHPYARPPTTNTPYNQEYGYEGYYQNNNKMSYPMPPRQQQQHQVSPHEGSPHPQYQSPMPPYHQANSMMMQQRQPPTIITTTKSPSLSSTSPSPTTSKSKTSSKKSKKIAANSKVKKPPRSYTEYNIFFQLERERILGNLIEEQEEKLKKNENDGKKETGDESCEDKGKGDDEKKDKEEGAEDTNNKDNNKEEDEEDKPYPTIDSKGRPLNTPSDSNDILPRPPRFAHLHLSPLWYDSTHRLAESKRNKAKRKHRKTHGLVGFLELTKMIAKEWKVVDTITKSYCKRVADRQLVLYKEEMKEVKKKQQLEEQEMLLNVVGEGNNVSGSGSKSGKKKQKKDERTPMQLQQMLRIQESTAPKEVIVNDNNDHVGRYPHQEYRDHQGGAIRHSYPPPPPSQYWSPRFAQQQGPPPQFRNEREGPSGYSSQRSIPQGYHHQQQYGHQGRPSSSSNRQQQHYSPPSNLPPLTPDSQFPMNDDHHHGVSSSAGNNNGNLLTPLDELNRRRALYGAQAAAIEAKSKFRSPGTSRLERAMRGQGGGSSSTSVNNRALISGKIQQDKVSSASYLSPADQGGVAMSAVTPSPSRRTAGLVIGASPDASSESTVDKGVTTSPPSNTTVDGSMTPSQLPMKKRRKKLLEENSEVDIDSDIKNKDTTTTTATTKPGLPIRHSSVNSVGGFLSSPGFGFQLSPSMGMMTPGGGNGTFGSPTQYHKALVGPYLNDNADGGVKSSPFPYIDWSPQESSPQDMKDQQQGGKPSMATRDHSRGVVPPHLGVPGGYHHGHHPIQYRHPGNMLGPHNGMSPGIGFADEGALDLDEEEMKLMWSKMATTAKRKRVASRDQAAAWMYGGSFAASPGGNMGGMMSWAHSFSTPGNLGRPDILARGMSNGSVMKKEETVSTDAESNSEEKKAEEAGKKTELPSLTEV